MTDDQTIAALRRLSIQPAREWLPTDVDAPTGDLIEGSLLVDASEVTDNPHHVRFWQIDQDDDQPTRWEHRPSGSAGTLGEVLVGIAACYVEQAVPLEARKAGCVVSGAELIAAERQRQVDVEGWTPEHDAEHGRGELIEAAISYAVAGRRAQSRPLITGDRSPYLPWPFDGGWKPSDDPIRNLVKAGALIAAEIDRLQQEATS